MCQCVILFSYSSKLFLTDCHRKEKVTLGQFMVWVSEKYSLTKLIKVLETQKCIKISWFIVTGV